MTSEKDKLRAKLWREKNPERARAIARACYLRHKARFQAESRAWAKANPDKIRARKIWNRYRLTPEEHARILARQGNACAICKEPRTDRIDHDHKTGKVRGVLCHCCNAALGLFKDRPDLLRTAADYLDASRDPSSQKPL